MKNQLVTLDDIKALPCLPRGGMVRQISSRSRMGINQDRGNYMYTDELGHSVIFDAKGPGYIRSMWATEMLSPITLRFYFNGEKTPSIEVDMKDFFSGKHPDFQPPYVSLAWRGYYLESDSLAGNSFAPIPFEESLRITAEAEHPFFYHIFWEQYPHGTELSNCRNMPAMEIHEEEKELTFSLEKLAPYRQTDLYKDTGSACVTGITIEASCPDRFLKEVYLCMRWDEAPYLQVQAPVGAFFGNPLGPSPVSTAMMTCEPVEQERIRLSCRWPMPYWSGAHIYLENRSNMTIPDITGTITVSSQIYDRGDSGYFTTLYRKGQTEHGRDWLLYESRGWGKFVGVIQTMDGGHYCEGDEHFYIDNACSPQMNGTGSEDYYLACFWPNPKFDTPHAGCIYDVHIQGGGLKDNYYRLPSAYYRFHLEAPIPFYRAIDARIQHGDMSNILSNYTSLAFCYLQKKPLLIQTDFIRVCNEAGADLHNYCAHTDHIELAVSSSPEGNYIDLVESLRGYHHRDGTITFEAAIDPANCGVRLRRRMDQKFSPQGAKVYIDDTYAGFWYEGDTNPFLRWYDSDFDIHPALTEGKTRIKVLLDVTCGERASYTDFTYSIYSFMR